MIAYLRTERDQYVFDAEETAHSGMRTPPRGITEIEAEAMKSQAAAAKRRSYQADAVNVINHDGLTPGNENDFAHHMQVLVRERNHRAAAERGDVPEPGRYQTNWNLFA